MDKKVYTLLDLAEEFGKDKQFIRRRIMKLKLKAINKNTREHMNEPLEYNHNTYMKLSKELGILDEMSENTYDTQSNTHETRGDTQNDTHETRTNIEKKDKLIEVLERELEHSKSKLKKSEEEKETLMKLLDQQQQLSLKANERIERLEYKEIVEKDEFFIETEKKEDKKKKSWLDIIIIDRFFKKDE